MKRRFTWIDDTTLSKRYRLDKQSDSWNQITDRSDFLMEDSKQLKSASVEIKEKSRGNKEININIRDIDIEVDKKYNSYNYWKESLPVIEEILPAFEEPMVID